VSLINEALRKARQAASEHESKKPDGPFQPVRAYPSRRSGSHDRLLAMALIAVVAAVVGAAAGWWFLGGRETASSDTTMVGGPAIEAATPLATPPGFPTPVDDRAAAESPEAPAQQEPAPTDVHASEAAAGVPAEAEKVVTESASAVAVAVAEKPVTGPNGERVFVMEAELGYASLSLGFIVARSKNSFAEINGAEVWIGSEIAGFVVEAIEADRVVLRDDRGLLILRVP
jgi:hypothetical protein